MCTARLVAESETVTGGADPRSRVRVRIQFSRSSAKGNNSHQPWLMTVRLKLKVGGVEILKNIFPINFLDSRRSLFSLNPGMKKFYNSTHHISVPRIGNGSPIKVVMKDTSGSEGID